MTKVNKANALHASQHGSMDWMDDGEWAIGKQLVDGEIRREIKLFKSSGDVAHLWRAWREARVRTEMPSDWLALIAPHIDDLAAPQNRSQLRAEQRSQRNWILENYYPEMKRIEVKRPGAARSESAVRTIVAKRFKTTAAAINQMVIDHKGRRGKGRKRGRGL